LHNLWIIFNDGFDYVWIEETSRKLEKQVLEGVLGEGQELRLQQASMDEVRSRFEAVEGRTSVDAIEKSENSFFISN